MNRFLIPSAFVFAGVLGFSPIGSAQSGGTPAAAPAEQTPASTDGPSELTNEQVAAAGVALLKKQMAQAATARIPLVIRHEARCVAVFPEITKVGLIVAGKSGRGLVSCRQPETGDWGVPVYYRIKAASIGLQAGVQTSSLVLVVVDEVGVEKLLAEKISLGSEAAVTAGPVGAEGGLQLGASILSYSRAQGAFVGIDVGGSTMSFDKEANAKTYGYDQGVKALLFRQAASTGNLKELRDTLNLFAPKKAAS